MSRCGELAGAATYATSSAATAATHPLEERVDELSLFAAIMVDVALFAETDEVVLAITHEHRPGRFGQVDFVFCEKQSWSG